MTLPKAARDARARPKLHPRQLKKRTTMTQAEKVLYTGKTHTTGGRDGAARSNDGRLDVKLSPPGSSAPGTNPEQMFAAGWSACFIGAMGRAAGKLGTTLPRDVAVDAEIDLVNAEDAFSLRARLNVSLPGVDRELAQRIVETAHQICPYSKATRGNIDVTLAVV
jgi:lipoyl-dependent peroxiredoxin